jgi:uncharacterized membrane protein
MSTQPSQLIAIGYDDRFKADEARLVLKRAEGEGLIELVETAVVVRGLDGKLQLTQDVDLANQRKMQGHWLGIAAAVATGVQPLILLGTAAGAIVGKLTDKGIGADVMKQIGKGLTPGTSALFVLARRTQHRDTVLERLRPLGGKVARSTLDPAAEQALSEALASEES